jgi:crotonobetainyl-CoA:carnitine CoA-transferase CaiB-like acyl-CoA transferase
VSGANDFTPGHRGSLQEDFMAEGALTGIKVIELGQGVSAPYCAKLFADYGADVIKVEPPGGDVARRWGPFPEDRPHPEKSGLFHFLNTNKRSVALDLGDAGARERLLRLVAGADVLVENHLPRQWREWGLDYAALSRENLGLVMISITPFGQTGPYSDWNACDLNAYHLSGASSRYCGRPGEAPLEHGTFAADFFGATAAASWTSRAPRRSPRPSSAGRTSAATPRTVCSSAAPAWACRWARPPPSSRARTGTCGCWRWSPASGRGSSK